MTDTDWGGYGMLPPFEDLDPRAAPVGESALRWLLLLGTALVAGLVLAAVFYFNGGGDWALSLAAGAVGAVSAGGVVWTRDGYSSSLVTRHAQVGWTALHAEITRCRRYERRFALVAIPEDVWAPGRAGRENRTGMALAAATALRPLLRTPDMAWADGSYVHVLLTDCDRTAAEAFLYRARERMPHMFPAGRVAVATFPEDGLTVGSLLTSLRLGRSQPSTPVAPL